MAAKSSRIIAAGVVLVALVLGLVTVFVVFGEDEEDTISKKPRSSADISKDVLKKRGPRPEMHRLHGEKQIETSGDAIDAGFLADRFCRGQY